MSKRVAIGSACVVGGIVVGVGIVAPLFTDSNTELSDSQSVVFDDLEYFIKRLIHGDRRCAPSAANACVNNLRQYDGAMQQWALEYKKATNDIPTWDDIRPY